MALIWISCDDNESQDVCFSFDIRQCQTDEFATDVPEAESKSEREENMKLWLGNQGINLTEIKLELNFHQSVCEACDVCPQGDRYFVKIAEETDMSLLSNLDLLNYELLDCSDAF